MSIKQDKFGFEEQPPITATDLPIVPASKGGLGTDASAFNGVVVASSGVFSATLPPVANQFLSGSPGGVAWVDPPTASGGGATGLILYPTNTASSDVAGAKQLSDTPSVATTSVAYAGVTTAYATLATYITEAGEPNAQFIDTGVATRHFRAWISAGGGSATAQFRVSMYYVDSDGVSNSTLIHTGESQVFSNTDEAHIEWSSVETVTYDSTSVPAFDERKRIKFVIEGKRANTGANISVSIRYGGQNSSYVITTIPNDEGCHGGQTAGTVGAPQSIGTLGTYYLIDGNFTAAPSYGFDCTVQNQLKRTCPGETKPVHMQFSISGFVSSTGDLYGFKVVKNGITDVCETRAASFYGFVQASISISTLCDKDDYFEVWVSNLSNYGDKFQLGHFGSTALLVRRTG